MFSMIGPSDTDVQEEVGVPGEHGGGGGLGGGELSGSPTPPGSA
jgi:hypothetical protein